MLILDSSKKEKVLIRDVVVADHVYNAIDALPVSAHPMTQFTTGVMALQVD